MTSPLFDAIERLTNPYEMQERVYRNRVDEDAADEIRAMAGYPNERATRWMDTDEAETVTPLEVIVIEDADHLKRVLDAATSMPYDLRREVAGALQDEAWIEDQVTHMQLVSALPNTGVFERLTSALRLHSWRRITA